MQMQKSPFLESGMGILFYHLDYFEGSGTLLGLGSKSTRS